MYCYQLGIMYGKMNKELVICEIRIDKAASRGDSESQIMSSSVIMPLNLQLLWNPYCKMFYIASVCNSWKWMTCLDKEKSWVGVKSCSSNFLLNRVVKISLRRVRERQWKISVVFVTFLYTKRWTTHCFHFVAYYNDNE